MLDAAMRSLRDSLSRPQHEDGNLWDDGPLPDLTSGVMWAVTGLFGIAALALPGSDRNHVVVALLLSGFAIGWGAFSLFAACRRRSARAGGYARPA